MLRHVLIICLMSSFCVSYANAEVRRTHNSLLNWSELPPLPVATGVSGPVVGVNHDALIVAGGVNFHVACGESAHMVDTTWRDDALVLIHNVDGSYKWLDGYQLDHAVGYSACVSTSRGIVYMGGKNGTQTLRACVLLNWDPESQQLRQTELPSLPDACAYGAATSIGDMVYLAGGLSGAGLQTAMNNFWRLDLSELDKPNGKPQWEQLPPWPGPARAFNLTVAQNNGFNDCIYVGGGQRASNIDMNPEGTMPLTDYYEFNPVVYASELLNGASTEKAARLAWQRRCDMPSPIIAGAASAVGQSHVFVLSGNSGAPTDQLMELKDNHPRLPGRVWVYHAITNTWFDGGQSPLNLVTTPAVLWNDDIVLAGREVGLRVLTNQLWRITPISHKTSFGAINSSLLVLYLLGVTGVGIYFTNKNKNTNDYFRGGQKIPWWAAGCSIFATMLSSLTFMAVPSKAYAQNLLYMMGAIGVIAMAPVAIYIALPFFRKINATSAYEYLSLRFNMPVRLIASGLFAVFHVFRIGIVLALSALALNSVTPLSPMQSVLLMGVLCLVYCTLGGIEAVIWTDTIQTIVILGGALLCLIMILWRLDGDTTSLFRSASADGKLLAVDWNFSLDSYTTAAFWVVIVGGFAANFSTYVSDQSVVQRYMTTANSKLAARSIWTNALLTIPAVLLFYGIGVALYMFYKAHPVRLDPTITADQIFPFFISNEVFVGAAGVLVAAVFAAAQSTVSTSMNSVATTIVTDFLQPFLTLTTDRGTLKAARLLTFLVGILGTMIGLMFINPKILSLLDEYTRIIGIFMGVLGGLFALGLFTKRANGWGALVGLVCGATAMFILPYISNTHPIIYAAAGIGVCCAVGYLASLLIPCRSNNIQGLTIYTQLSDRHRTLHVQSSVEQPLG